MRSGVADEEFFNGSRLSSSTTETPEARPAAKLIISANLFGYLAVCPDTSVPEKRFA